MAKRDENEAIGVHVAPQRPVLLPKPRKTDVDIMAIGCKRHEGSAENLEVWDISVAFNGLTEKDGSQLLLGYVREGTERLPRRICLKVDKAWSLCNSL